MSNFYYQKYYRSRGQDRRFYIPLLNHRVNIDLLRKEVETIIKPIEHGSYGLTTSKDYTDETPHNWRRYSQISRLDSLGERKLESGERDEDIVYWPKELQGSYIQELGYKFSDLLKIKDPRVRMSLQATTGIHNDPHTPYRIHIALETDPSILWLFIDENNKAHQIHQPADGVPVLIETGITRHSVMIPRNAKKNRIHLWYQFHGLVSDNILSNF